MRRSPAGNPTPGPPSRRLHVGPSVGCITRRHPMRRLANTSDRGWMSETGLPIFDRTLCPAIDPAARSTSRPVANHQEGSGAHHVLSTDESAAKGPTRTWRKAHLGGDSGGRGAGVVGLGDSREPCPTTGGSRHVLPDHGRVLGPSRDRWALRVRRREPGVRRRRPRRDVARRGRPCPRREATWAHRAQRRRAGHRHPRRGGDRAGVPPSASRRGMRTTAPIARGWSSTPAARSVWPSPRCAAASPGGWALNSASVVSWPRPVAGSGCAPW